MVSSAQGKNGAVDPLDVLVVVVAVLFLVAMAGVFWLAPPSPRFYGDPVEPPRAAVSSPEGF